MTTRTDAIAERTKLHFQLSHAARRYRERLAKLFPNPTEGTAVLNDLLREVYDAWRAEHAGNPEEGMELHRWIQGKENAMEQALRGLAEDTELLKQFPHRLKAVIRETLRKKCLSGDGIVALPPKRKGMPGGSRAQQRVGHLITNVYAEGGV